MLDRIKLLYRKKYDDIINILFVIYVFVIPINHNSLTRLVFNTILIVFIFDKNLILKIKMAFKNRFVQAVLLFYFIHIVSYLMSDYKEYAEGVFSTYRYMLQVVIYIVSIKKEYVLTILKSFLYSMMFSEFMSYLIHFRLIEPFNSATVSDPVPFMLSHTTYALFLSISVAMMLYFLLSKKYNLSLYIKILYIMFFFSSSINLFIIASRIGYILYFVSVFIVLFFLYKKNILKLLSLFILMSMISFFVAYNFSDTFKIRYNQTIDNTMSLFLNKNFHTSIGVRIGQWYYAYNIIKDHYLIGVGDGNHIEMMKKIVQEKEKNKANKDMLLHSFNWRLHSDYLEIGVKLGILGLLLYFNIYFQLLKFCSEYEVLNVLKYIMIYTYLIYGLQQSVIISRDLGKMLLIFSVLVIVSNIKKDKNFVNK